jgi:hypothetical protein
MTANNPRPTDPLTALDAAQIMGDFQDLKKVITESIATLNERIDVIAREQQSIRSNVNFFSADFAISRDQRNKLEVTELQKEEQILLQRLSIVREKLATKKHDVASGNTQEKLRAIAAQSYEERERLEKEARDKWWKDTFQQAARTVIIGGAVTLSGAIFAALVWFVMFYLQNR